MALKLKTAAGLLMVIISCLVVAMLGYRAYAEGFAEGAQPRKNVVREARISNAVKVSGPNTAVNNNNSSQVRVRRRI